MNVISPKIALTNDASTETLPTPVPPSFRVAAVASVAGLRDSCGNMPLDACIPMRLEAAVPPTLGARSALVLSQIDGRLTLRELSVLTELSLSETIEAYLDLLLQGLVDVRLPSHGEEH